MSHHEALDSKGTLGTLGCSLCPTNASTSVSPIRACPPPSVGELSIPARKGWAALGDGSEVKSHSPQPNP